MFVKNITGKFQSFQLNGVPFFVAPGNQVSISDEQAETDEFKILLSKNVMEKVEFDKAVKRIDEEAAEKQKQKDDKKPDIDKQKDERKVVFNLPKCAATLANGEPCNNTVKVKPEKYNEHVPYFCGVHRNENPADYELVDDKWIKIQ